MALDFGKLEFSVSFNPTSAFPLDARSYFESLESAQNAAASATAVGGADSAYYVGQTLVVVENEVATFYVIQPNKTLSPVGDKIKVNTNLFEYDENGNLSLKGFDEATVDTVFVKNADGTLSWKSMVDAYSKTETDEKIRKAVAAASHMRRKIVDDITEIDLDAADADLYIYMVPTSREDSNKYDEYMVITLEDNDGDEVRFIEKIGSWDVNLEDYATKDDLNNKVDKVAGSTLITEVDLNKLMGIAPGAEVNYIKSVSTDFTVQEGQLNLQMLNISKINGLKDSLDSKVDKIEGHTLLSPADQEKLALLQINGDDLMISGTVTADSVLGLEEWLNNHSHNTPGLSEQNFTKELKEKLQASLFISAVEETQLKVDDGKLSIIAIDKSKITGLEDALTAYATTESLAQTNKRIDDIDLSNYVTKQLYQTEIDRIWDTLTWKDIQ